MRSSLVLAGALALAGATDVRADAKADVTAAYAAFIDGVVAGKPDLTGVELFIPPGTGTHDDKGEYDGVPEGLADAKASIAKPKLKVTRVIVSKGGKSAWIAGELAGKVTRKGKSKSEPVRVSAFLVNDGKAWRTQASHWSIGEPDVKSETCGDVETWKLKSKVAKEQLPTFKSLEEALFPRYGDGDPARLAKVLSDDKNALVIGSAPKETFSGGAKIKSLFKKWTISASFFDDGTGTRGAIGPDGEMMWVGLGVSAPRQVCATYRTLFVLAKESGGWKIVHHHYSQPMNPS